MKDLISRDLVKSIIRVTYDGCCGDAMDYRDLMCLRVNELPNEHRNGEWLKGGSGKIYCSFCGYVKRSDEMFWYCPKCGAEMDEVNA